MAPISLRQHPEDAVPEFERELEISPSHVLARIRLAEQLIAQRDFDRALALAQQAIKLDPKRASAHLFAGEALLAKGEPCRGHQGTGNRARHRSHSKSGRIGICFAPISPRGGKKMRIGRSRRLKNCSNRNSQSHPRDAGDSPHDPSAPLKAAGIAPALKPRDLANTVSALSHRGRVSCNTNRSKVHGEGLSSCSFEFHGDRGAIFIAFTAWRVQRVFI